MNAQVYVDITRAFIRGKIEHKMNNEKKTTTYTWVFVFQKYEKF